MRILLVEDNKVTLEIVDNALTERGFAVDKFTKGKNALIEFEITESIYDVIILDIILPDANGVELCQKIRERDKETPILFLTAMSDTDDVVKGLEAGGDDYMTKPFSARELIARVETLLRRKGKEIVDQYKVGRIKLDRAKRKAFDEKREIELTSLEFRLLELLMGKKGSVVSRAEIIEKVWQNSDDLLSNSVDVHIRSLRKKLKHSKKRPIINTKRGVGYMFAESI